MYESKHKKIAPFQVFAKRLALNLLLGFFTIAVCLFVGMLGYRYLENMRWIDAYVNAAMILSGMGPVQELKTDIGKLFAGSYALFSGIFFLVLLALTFSPIIHRLFHKFHLEDK